MKKIFSLIFAGGLTISGLSAQEKLNVLYVPQLRLRQRNALPISSNFSGSTSPK